MTTYIDSHIISLTSDTATTINSTLLSDANYEFRGLLREDPNIIQRQISILSAQIPVSFYNINEYNNLFKGIVNLSSFIFQIPNGNYNANSLCTVLNNYIQIVQSYPDISFTVDKVTGKLSWKYLNPTDNPTLTLKFEKESTCQELFGFAQNVDYYSTQVYVAGGNSYVEIKGVYPMNLLGPKVLSIKSPSLNTANVSSYYKGANTLLATIPIDAPLFGQIDYHNYSNLRTTFLNGDLNNIEIQIYDEKNQLVDFNGVHWSITLAIHLTKSSLLDRPQAELRGIATNPPLPTDSKISTTDSKISPPTELHGMTNDQILFS